MKRSACLLLLTLVPLWAGPPTIHQSNLTEAPSPFSSDPTSQTDLFPSVQISESPGSSPTPEHNATDTLLPNQTHDAAATHSPGGRDSTTTSTASTAAAESCMFGRRQGRVLLMVVGVLMVACVGLLVTNALLTWKVCRRVRDTEADSDLISTSEFWMGSAQRNKARHKQPPSAGDNCLLLGHLEMKEEERGADGGGGGEGEEAADKKKEVKGGEEEVEAGGGANGTAGVLGPEDPTESGPSADPCPGEGSRGPEDPTESGPSADPCPGEGSRGPEDAV